jgi:UDP-glucose 4-epimerase
MGRRVLITGLDSFWGGRMAQALEADPDVELILGMGRKEPTVPLERTEYVRADQTYSILARIVAATQVDTVVHTFLAVDSNQAPGRVLHEMNVIGTMNLLAACGQAGSSVRHVVIKSSTMVYGASARDPYWFREDHRRPSPPTTRLERSLIEVESLVRDFAEDNPAILVTVLRFANVLGNNIVTPISANLSRRLVPAIAGYDPLVQFVEEGDVVRCLAHVTRNRIGGLYNVAGDGKVTWHEVAHLARAAVLPLPDVATGVVAAPLCRLGLIDFPPELEPLLRFGRGVDTSRLRATGFRFEYTTLGAIHSFLRALHLRRSLGRESTGYTFEQDVEQFFRHSPAVVHHPTPSA